MPLTRRSFLGLSAAGVAVLGLGAVGLGVMPSVIVPPATPLKALSPRAFSVLAAIAARVCPGGDGFPSAAEVRVAEKVDALMATLPPASAAELEQALMLVENGLTGLLLHGRVGTFTAATPAQQDAALASWQTSSWALRRQVFKALRGLVAASYYGSPEVYAAVGYPGPPDYAALLAARDAEAEPVAAEAAP